MNLLGAANYDPAVAVSKATSSLTALTAVDTTNLRLAITVPAHGIVRFRLRCTITGATTLPTILLGVLNSTTVVGRVAPIIFPGTMNATTQQATADAEFTVTGLTPGAANFDAAYAVQVVVASTNIKYGGPNNATGANAWGAFTFEAWDPRPISTTAQLAVDSGGRVTANVTQVNGTTQTARDLGAQLDATVSSRMATYTQPTGFLTATFPATVASTTNITAASGITLAAVTHTGATIPAVTTVTNLTNAPTAGDFTATMKTSITTAATAATPTAAAVTGAVGSVTGNVGGNVVGSVGSVTGAVGSVTGNVGGNVNGSVGSVVGLTAANLDVAVSTRLASASYSAPLDAAGTRTAVGLAAANLDTQLGTLATSAALSSVATDVTTIKGKTNSLNFTVPGYTDVNIRYVNSVLVNGDGAGTPWGP